MAKFFENAQWLVTDEGIESRPPSPSYKIPSDRLLEMSRGYYDWPEHMAEKSWVNAPAFVEAYVAALDALQPEFDKELLKAALANVGTRR